MRQVSNHVKIAVAMTAALVAIIAVPVSREAVRAGYELIVVTIAPSAAVAYQFGDRHFNAANQQAYNITLASYFFEKAADINPSYPYVQHELARLAFLKGDFVTAMKHINLQISMTGASAPNSYYVRGLIEGYLGDYVDSAKDYETYLSFDPTNWAAMNDYAWVLLKDKRFQDAARVTDKGLSLFPENAWLLNSNSIALFELGEMARAFEQAKRAVAAVQLVTNAAWLHAYPGNDPAVAGAGLSTFKKAAVDNMHTIERSLSTSTIQ